MFQALIIEDDREWIEKLEEALLSMNFSCLIAKSVNEGKNHLRASGKSIGIIFACLDKERMDGLEAAGEQYILGYNRPIIGTSNHKNLKEYESLKVSGILSKELEQMELRDNIDKIFWDHRETSKSKPRKPIVLIVEDNDIQASLLSGRLIKCGLEPYVAVNGLNGLVEVKKIFPQLIIIDMNMPIMDGYTLASLLKESDETKHIPIIGVSASAQKEKCLKAGCDFYFSKPYDKRLLALVQEAISNSAKAS